MKNKYYELKTKIFSGNILECNAIDNLIDKSVGIICDKNVSSSSSKINLFIDKINKEYNVSLIYYDYKFEPSYQYLDDLMKKIKSDNNFGKISCWIGIGGGSAMDTAKAVAFLSKNSGPSIQYRGFPEGKEKPLPVIAVPTTTGTGSEVVFNASFIDEDSKVKMGINDKNNYPALSILDPEIASTAPLSVLASSGTDALVHALEGFTSPASTHITRVFSKKAFHLIMENMSILLENKGNLENWLNMQWAAVFAMFGLSINDTSGPAGAFSYYLGTNFNVPHGVAGGVFIGKVSRLNHIKGYNEYSKLIDWQGSEKMLDTSEEEKSDFVVSKIEKLLLKSKIPSSIFDLGVKEDDLSGFLKFYEGAIQAFDFNPVSFNKNDIMELLK